MTTSSSPTELCVGESVDVIRNVFVGGPGRELLPFLDVCDVFVGNGQILDIAPAGVLPARGRVIDGQGGWLLPGLWDHHVHVLQWALMARRTQLAHAESSRHAAALMAHAEILPDGRRIGVGYRDALWPDEVLIDTLDEVTGNVPTYLINADLHSVWLNSAALAREQMTAPQGVLREEPAFEISRRLMGVDPHAGDQQVSTMALEAAARGVVGLVDFDMAWNEESWSRRVSHGFDILRVEFGIYPASLSRAISEGLRTGDRLREVDSDLVRVGPLKVISDGSLGTRTAACSHAYTDGTHNHGVMTIEPDRLLELMTDATAHGLNSAIHAIGDVAARHALDVFAHTGAQGTIEHAQLVSHTDIMRFSRLGVGASVQPAHALDDRDITDVEWADQTGIAYPLRALAQSGVSLTFGSDAPVSTLDPWEAMAAAAFRTRDGREPWRPDQALDVATAFAASTRRGSLHPDSVLPGAPADLIIATHDPASCSERQLREMTVRATMIEGRLTHVAS